MSRRRAKYLLTGAGLSVVALVAAACSGSDVSQEDYDSLQSQLNVKTEEVTTLQNELDNVAPSQIVQVGQTQPASPDEVVTDWDTEYSVHAQTKLLATYDSSGEQAWDPAEHPTVFVTSEGEGYAGYISETYKGAGLYMINAETREIVASAEFDLGFEKMAEPHGLAVSPDGRWIYVPTSDADAPWQAAPGEGRIMVVDARTLKLNQVIQTFGGPHHLRAFTDSEGNDRMIVEDRTGHILLLDPNDQNRVVFAVGPDEVYGQIYQASVDPAGEFLYLGLTLGGRGPAPELEGAVGKVSLATGRVTYIPGVGMYPNGFAFTSDGRFTYVADSSGDRVYKIDNSTNEVVASTQAATPGPYDIALNLDETELWVVGKGEMTFNLGGTLGLIDTRSFTAVNQFDIDGQTIDHAFLNPANPDELWVTSSGTAETIVWNMADRVVTARVSTPNTGDTHGGAFVKYDSSFNGELLADKTGPQGELKERQRAAAAALAAAR